MALNITDILESAAEQRAQMRVAEAIELRQSLEREVRTLVDNFCLRTGLKVTDLELTHALSLDGWTRVTSVSARVEV